jgi:hypothetical protein
MVCFGYIVSTLHKGVKRNASFNVALLPYTHKRAHSRFPCNAVIFLLFMIEERLACVLRQLLVQECSARHRDISLQAHK